MGWSYEERLAYGITVNAWNNPGLKRLLLKLADIVTYDKEMSLDGPGTVFIYLNSTYKTVKKDSGSYAFSSPDPSGDEFNPPRHPIIHRIEDNPTNLSELELSALREIGNFCNTTINPVSIRHSFISY